MEKSTYHIQPFSVELSTIGRIEIKTNSILFVPPSIFYYKIHYSNSFIASGHIFLVFFYFGEFFIS